MLGLLSPRSLPRRCPFISAASSPRTRRLAPPRWTLGQDLLLSSRVSQGVALLAVPRLTPPSAHERTRVHAPSAPLLPPPSPPLPLSLAVSGRLAPVHLPQRSLKDKSVFRDIGPQPLRCPRETLSSGAGAPGTPPPDAPLAAPAGCAPPRSPPVWVGSPLRQHLGEIVPLALARVPSSTENDLPASMVSLPWLYFYRVY